MFLNPFLFVIIYVTSKIVAKDIHIPLCAAWNTTGTVIIGSEDGQSGTNETMLNQPTAIVAVDKNDILYVVDSGNNRLMKYEHGSDIGEQVNISDGTLNNPQDIAIDESGGIYISEAGNNRVVKWTFDPPSTEILIDSTDIRSPSGIYLNETTNELYVLGQHEDGYPVVKRYDLNSTKIEKVVGDKPPTQPPYFLSSLYTPIGIHVDRKQRIYVVESGSHRITRWKAKQYYGERVAGTEKCGAELSDLCIPTSFILDDTDTMYIADRDRILRWTQNVSERACLLGCNFTIGNQTFHQPIQPYDITFDSNHNLLVVEKDLHRIKRFNFDFNKTCSKLFYSK
jgi:sugar lactone lactonase YvrE